MSLYDKTIEELSSYMERLFQISKEVKQKIINECIDGEVLIEFNSQDYKIFELNPFLEETLKIIVNSVKNDKKEIKMEEIIKKLNSFGIKQPEDYLNKDLEKLELKIGQKIMLKKYVNLINSKPININSSYEDISKYFKEKLQISDESINKLKGINGALFLELGENIFKVLDIKEEDKNKLMKFIISQNSEKIDKTQEEENISDIEKKTKLEQMIIYESNNIKISIDTLYEKMESDLSNIMKQNKENKLSKHNPYYLELNEEIKVNINKIYNSIVFDFSIGNLFAKHILMTPIKGKININNSLLDIDIISYKQLNFIIDENKIIKPCIECSKCKDKCLLSYVFLINHSKCNSILIYETMKVIELSTEKEFNEFFPKLETRFNTPLKFEINFSDYFNNKKMIKETKPFTYYTELDNRKALEEYFTNDESFGKYFIFFGFPGIGKSIGVIYTLKYIIDHKEYKTLYIHCKHLYLLSKAYNWERIKKIFLSEIPYLFYNDFLYYRKCVDTIKRFKFSYKNTYIDLIEVIFNLLENKNGKYIIVFDQYNKFSDPENKIYDLIMKILNNRSICKKFAFFSFMSLNNKDVKEIKIEKILNINQVENKEEKIDIEEINYIFEEKYSNNKKQKIFEKVGKTIKNYNELLDIKEKNLKEYYQKKKDTLKYKLIEFYNKECADKLSFYGMSKLMKISVGIPYDEEEIKKLFQYINFKYFEIKKIDDHYEIFYLSPIVEEALKEIYYSFVYDNQHVYEKLLNFNLIKGGGKGCCFEQIVENILTPSHKTGNYIIPNLIIGKKETIPQFLPKNNEVNIPFMDEEINLKHKTYLIEQEIFGGKAVDFIIIEPQKTEHIIYAFQVSILKEKIFDEEQIKNILIKMSEYIKNFIKNIKVRKENLYFGYIFSLINEKKPDFNSMINACKKNKIPYSFLDLKVNKFLNNEKKPVNSIYEMTFNPYGISPITSINKDNLPIKRINFVKKVPSFAMTKEIKDKIFQILKDVHNKNIIDIDYQLSLNKLYLNSYNFDFFYTVYEEIPLIVIITPNKYIIYKLLENQYFNAFSSLVNDEYLFDCYFIQFEGEEKKQPIYSDDSDEDINEIYLNEKQKIIP